MGLSLAGIFLSIVVFLARPYLVNLLVHFGARYISSDGIVTDEGVRHVERALNALQLAGFIGGTGGITYAVGLEYFCARLPKDRDDEEDGGRIKAGRMEVAGILLTLGVGSLLRLHHLGRNLYYDELFSAYHFFDTSSFWETVSTYIVFNNHILYSLLGRAAIITFGRAEWAIRLPAFLLGLATIYALWFFVRTFFSQRMALMGALALALSPTHVYWSVSARGYTGMVLFSLLSSYFFLRLLRRPKKMDMALFVLTTVAAGYFHLYALWVTGVQFLFLIYLAIKSVAGWAPEKDRLGRRSFYLQYLSFPAIGLLLSLLYTPILGSLIRSVRAQGTSEFSPEFALLFVEEFTGNMGLAAGFVLLVVAVAGAWHLLQRFSQEAVYFLLTLAIPLPIVWLFLRPVALYSRFFSYFLPYFLVFVAAGFVVLWRCAAGMAGKSLRTSLRVLVLTIGLFYLAIWSGNSWLNIPEETDFREVLAYMSEQPADLCVFGEDAEIFRFYTNRELLLPHSTRDLAQILQDNQFVICVYHDARWSRQEYIEMSEFMNRRSVQRPFRKLILYTYQG